MLILLHPFAPHTTEELWERLLHKECLAHQTWPAYEKKYLENATFEYALQINGKVRATFTVLAGTSADVIKEMALNLANTKGLLNGHAIVKVIFVENRLVNIVVK